VASIERTAYPRFKRFLSARELHVFYVDTSFASDNWNKAIRDRARPGMFVRRHLEACVLTYLAEELRTGDIAVLGAATYANWANQLLTPEEVAVRLPAFCAEVGIPATAAEFRADLQTRLDTQCRGTDAAYPDLADFTIDDNGRPSLKQYRAAGQPTRTRLHGRGHYAGEAGPHPGARPRWCTADLEVDLLPGAAVGHVTEFQAVRDLADVVER
jgi:hypothetical protein